ncbi:UDP-N-acetylglucosamine 1-carboxyvinyltransferase [Paramagnetospirillum marisnigri]|uniref:UDP-N-acetylglucosamine 1-carboxyvinyltransferase n=1 Tax=Paramagnetospirillum marisnigri TaxID=1285242 RepID=A0A178MD62_9PROT|nr:UDP-N-acetylglucosamine 1-carboxyvinyltransferase [Paramagnetospirillum marisnigri]OAN46750.1 UDP-N-acetylglucosamine 1-carboxyvinyltransferase [Paramagnetospirillum marisnigri]
MDRIRIHGGTPLKGTITIGGAKNAALTLMPACLLTDETLSLANLPHLVDITTMANLLAQHGARMILNGDAKDGGHTGRVLELTAAEITNTTAPYDLVRKMRASVLVLGPLLARCGQARVSLPGGCAIGTRPVDLHLKALEQMGAVIELEEGYIVARVNGRLKGAHIIFPQVTVGGTENILMAACLAEGETVIANAAREPEVADLAHCLVAMGANIDGIGSGTLRVQGVDRLHGARYSVVPDRIETGSYAVAAAITRGDIELVGARFDLMESVNKVLTECGVLVEETPRGMRVSAEGRDIRGVDIMTEPYPGFPTDMQAQLMALMATSSGASMITETIFENRFMHVPEMTRMGARINVHGASAIVRGAPRLSGAQVMATDLRASVSLILAGLAAEGETIINRVYHLDRGYERVEEKLAACGARIERIKDTAAE